MNNASRLIASAVSTPENALSSSAPCNLPSEKGLIHIFESEVRFMAVNSITYGNKETGGELFGLKTRSGRTVVLLATPPGPNAIHRRTHFTQDFIWMKERLEYLWVNYALQYFGRWHSHHYLGLYHPSGLDSDRIQSVSSENGIAGLIEMILTFDGDPTRGIERVNLHPYIYPDLGSPDYLEGSFRILPGTSPFRLAIENQQGMDTTEKTIAPCGEPVRESRSEKRFVRTRRQTLRRVTKRRYAKSIRSLRRKENLACPVMITHTASCWNCGYSRRP
jgi:hypothetical protein